MTRRTQTTMRFDPQMLRALDKDATARGISRTRLVERVLLGYLALPSKDRKVAGLEMPVFSEEDLLA